MYFGLQDNGEKMRDSSELDHQLSVDSNEEVELGVEATMADFEMDSAGKTVHAAGVETDNNEREGNQLLAPESSTEASRSKSGEHSATCVEDLHNLEESSSDEDGGCSSPEIIFEPVKPKLSDAKERSERETRDETDTDKLPEENEVLKGVGDEFLEDEGYNYPMKNLSLKEMFGGSTKFTEEEMLFLMQDGMGDQEPKRKAYRIPKMPVEKILSMMKDPLPDKKVEREQRRRTVLGAIHECRERELIMIEIADDLAA